VIASVLENTVAIKRGKQISLKVALFVEYRSYVALSNKSSFQSHILDFMSSSRSHLTISVSRNIFCDLCIVIGTVLRVST